MLVTPLVLGPADLPQYTTWCVIDDLDDLRGPDHGWMELPNRLWWNPHPRFWLDDRDQVRAAYRAVLREAASEDDLVHYINRDLLIATWSRLFLPERLRDLWVGVHPELGQVRDADLVAA